MPVQYLNEEEAKAQTDAGHIYWRPYRGDGGAAPGMWDPDARAVPLEGPEEDEHRFPRLTHLAELVRRRGR